jgi:uncharacterized protein YukE
MTIIHMDPDSLQSTLRVMRTLLDSIEEELAVLHSQPDRLQNAWSGGRSAKLAAALRQVQDQLQKQATAITNLLQAAEREMNEWIEVDGHGFDRNADWHMDANGFPLPVTLISGAGFSDGILPAISLPLIWAALQNGLTSLSAPDWLRRLWEKLFPPPIITTPIPPDGPGTTVPPAKPLEPEPPEATPSATTTPAGPAKSDVKYTVYNDVPVQGQGNLYGNAACSASSVSMVTEFFHNKDAGDKAISASDLINTMDKTDGTSGKGIGLSNLEDEVKDLGYKTYDASLNANMDNLKSQLSNGPVIVVAGVGITSNPRTISGSGSTMHAMVVKGLTENNQVVVNDPWTGQELTFESATFDKMWAAGQKSMVSIRP